MKHRWPQPKVIVEMAPIPQKVLEFQEARITASKKDKAIRNAYLPKDMLKFRKSGVRPGAKLIIEIREELFRGVLNSALNSAL